MDDIATPRWSTTNSAYGSPRRLGAGKPQEQITVPDLSPRRPQGHDIGSSRPWRNMNQEQLSPRVPSSWFLGSPSSSTSAGHDQVLARIRGGHSPREVMASSQRDPAVGYSLMLSDTLGLPKESTPRARAVQRYGAWYSLHGASDAYGPFNGRPGFAGVADRREKGAQARAAYFEARAVARAAQRTST
jgi:hypothetical protein